MNHHLGAALHAFGLGNLVGTGTIADPVLTRGRPVGGGGTRVGCEKEIKKGRKKERVRYSIVE